MGLINIATREVSSEDGNVGDSASMIEYEVGWRDSYKKQLIKKYLIIPASQFHIIPIKFQYHV